MGRLSVKISVLLMLGVVFSLFIFNLDYFNVKNFSIHNLQRVKKNDIIKIIQQYQNQNILSVNTKDLKQKLLENPEIEDVIIKRKLPDTIVIYVYEKRTVGLIKYLNSYIEIDKNGYVIRIEGDLPQYSIVFEGLKVTQAAVGNKIIVTDEVLLQKAIDVAQGLLRFNALKVFKVKELIVLLKNISDVQLKMDKLTIKLGDGSDIDYKLRLLKGVYDKLPKNVEGVITLNSNGIATFTPNTGEDN
ncbi:cell division protein FtsQ/DivIB [Anaerocellum danielii]|uniref:FtsQ-type POTRA domain-containing protein n=1 Tax=Anaerocellum danielii TaxID=1387557 RepID=A0ABZ0U1J0_9FIRM|nr:FtsQ-type POTRA domain-containing protein [Caldicellulosiruptor danielii]WPX09550.1 FtsQ-type POTRA domain-containing protein [Caldicellulosiruptor danielii]